MLYTILIIIAVVIAAVLAYAATRPSTFRVARSLTIQAPAEKIFPLINDFHQWTVWSPYEKLDSTMQKTYSGAQQGKGAIYTWNGSNKVGTGRMEITDATPPNKIVLQLDFEKPFQAHNIGEFTLEVKDDTTTVTWAMTGNYTYMTKVMGLFFSMDKLVGKDFEAGLANLKTATEK